MRLCSIGIAEKVVSSQYCCGDFLLKKSRKGAEFQGQCTGLLGSGLMREVISGFWIFVILSCGGDRR